MYCLFVLSPLFPEKIFAENVNCCPYMTIFDNFRQSFWHLRFEVLPDCLGQSCCQGNNATCISGDCSQFDPSGDQQVPVVPDFAGNDQTGFAQLGDDGADFQEVIVVCGMMEIQFAVDDLEEYAFGFEVAIDQALRAEHLGPADLKVAQVVRVIDDAHLVSVSIGDADLV